MIRLRFFNTLTLFTLLAQLSWAQSSATALANPPKPNVDARSESEIIKADKKQSMNFEDELIEGTALKPDMFYLFQKNNFKFKKLIKLRENFLPEMNRNSEDIQRLRGGR